jgi:preprotein translocase subunit SecG
MLNECHFDFLNIATMFLESGFFINFIILAVTRVGDKNSKTSVNQNLDSDSSQ